MQLWLGIDVASRAAHQASLADESGRFLWSGHRFRTGAEDLERLWAMLPERGTDTEVLVILEPTRNAWVALAAWFRRRGARVVLVPPERSADLRDYYHKHTKSDRLDSRLLARLPLLHPEGLHDEHGLGPGDPLRRATRLRQSLVQRRTKSLARLDALLELLGPKWLEAFRADLANKTPLRFLAAGYACPDTVERLGRARLGRFLYRHSRGHWGPEHAAALLDAAEETLALWEDAFDFDQLAEDIAVEARLALILTDEVAALDERIALLFEEADPEAILTSAPGIGPVTGPQILARLGDPNRFRSLAGVRSFSGLVPSLNASGVSGRHGRPTRRGDAALREAIFIAADHARRIDPRSPRATSGSWSRPANTTTRRSAISPRRCSRASSPAGGAASATSSATATAGPSPWPRGGASSPSATPSQPRCAASDSAPARARARGRAAAVRSRRALRRRPVRCRRYNPSPELDIR